MNNFVFSQDPLLYTSLANRQNPQIEYDMKRQLDEAMAQYQNLSQNPPQPKTPQSKDYLGEIDNMVSDLNSVLYNLWNRWKGHVFEIGTADTSDVPLLGTLPLTESSYRNKIWGSSII